MGCGNGAVTATLAADGYSVCGFDASSEGIGVARSSWPNLQFVEASMEHDQLAVTLGSGFDAAVSLEVVEHLYLPRVLFKRADELLRPGGLLLVSTPYHGYLKNLALSLSDRWDRHFTAEWDGGHIKFFSPRTLAGMAAESGFTCWFFCGAGRVPYLWKSMILGFRSNPRQ